MLIKSNELSIKLQLKELELKTAKKRVYTERKDVVTSFTFTISTLSVEHSRKVSNH